MGKSIAAERTWPIRLLALAAALAMVAVGLVTASTAAAADEEADNITINFQQVVCQDYRDVRGNELQGEYGENSDLDDTDGGYGDWGDHLDADDLPVQLLDHLGGRLCEFAEGWTFEYWTGGQTPPEEVSDITETAKTGADGLVSVDDVDLQGDDQLWIRSVNKDDKFDFGALQCGNDALHPDNLEFVQADHADDEDNINCVAWSVDQDLFEVADCGDSDDCTVNVDDDGQDFSATAAGAPKENGRDVSTLGLRAPSGGVAGQVFEACTKLANESDTRLGDGIAQLVPVGFEDGDITVSSTIPRSQVNDAVTRGNPFFGVCVAPGVDEAGVYGLDPNEDAIDGTGFVGPILLDDCEINEDTACIESRQRVRGADLVITYRLPAADPMLR